MEGNNLIDCNYLGKSDPYALVRLGPVSMAEQHLFTHYCRCPRTLQSKVMPNKLNPIWAETFYFRFPLCWERPEPPAAAVPPPTANGNGHDDSDADGDGDTSAPKVNIAPSQDRGRTSGPRSKPVSPRPTTMTPRFVSRSENGSKREKRVSKHIINARQSHAPTAVKMGDRSLRTGSESSLGLNEIHTHDDQHLLSTDTTTGALGPPLWVEIAVFDRGVPGLKEDRFMGKGAVSCQNLTRKNCVDMRVALENVVSGSIHVRVSIDYKLVHLNKDFLKSR